MTWFKRIALGLLVLILTAGAISYVSYRFWLHKMTSGLSTDSIVAQTSRGPVEYIELGQGQPLLVIYGTPGGYDMARSLAAMHADMKAVRYIVPSRPGYLRTPLSVGRTPDEQAQAFAALLDTLKIRRAAVYAVSGGGPAGLAFAVRYPDRCAALVLEETITRREQSRPAENVPGLSLVQDYLVWLASFGLEAGWQARAPHDRDIPAISESLLRTVVPAAARADGVANDVYQFQNLAPLDISRITCPTLILQGTADKNVDPSMADYAHERISGSTLVKLPGYDHFMVIYAHKQLVALTQKFLREHKVK